MTPLLKDNAANAIPAVYPLKARPHHLDLKPPKHPWQLHF